MMTENPAPVDSIGTRPSSRDAEPDAHGQAALLLAESTIHALIETNTLSRAQAIEIVRSAVEVKVDVAAETGESAGRMRHSIALLTAIEQSLTAGEERAAESD